VPALEKPRVGQQSSLWLDRRLKGCTGPLRYARDRLSEFVGMPKGDALTRIFFKLHHYENREERRTLANFHSPENRKGSVY
jgi:hypothetical protein